MGGKGKNELEKVEVHNRTQWRAWLKAHHRQEESIWLVTHKKHTGARYVPYTSVVEEALCFGWIDSLRRPVDGDRTMLLLSPRRPGSAWSPSNKERVRRLTAQKRMAPAGMDAVARARRDGSWSRLDQIETIPADFAATLADEPPAAQHFEAFSPSLRRGILAWIGAAKTEETRRRRMQHIARLAAQNLKPGQAPSRRRE